MIERPKKETPEAIEAYYFDLLAEMTPGITRIKWLLGEVVRLRQEHYQAAMFAWELYLAGTGQTMETFTGPRSEDPVEDVRAAQVMAPHQLRILEQYRGELCALRTYLDREFPQRDRSMGDISWVFSALDMVKNQLRPLMELLGHSSRWRNDC